MEEWETASLRMEFYKEESSTIEITKYMLRTVMELGGCHVVLDVEFGPV